MTVNAKKLILVVAATGAAAAIAVPTAAQAAEPSSSAAARTAAAGVAAAPVSSSASASASASASGPVATIQSKRSFACASPKGQHLNVSWSPGTVSTTVYFNNHCKQRRVLALRLQYQNTSKKGWGCIWVNGKTKGKKKRYTDGWKIIDIKSPKKAPVEC